MSLHRGFRLLTSHLKTVQGKSFLSQENNGVVKCGIEISSENTRKYSSSVNLKKLRVGVQGAPFDRGQPKPGVERGPEVIRSSGFIDTLRDVVGHDIVDFGDIPFNLQPRQPNIGATESGLKNSKIVGEANRMISDSTSKIVKDGRICLTLGGDHSIGIGTVHGVSEVYNDLAVLWVDAHCDINTTGTTPTGNMHGMSMAFLIKELQSSMEKLPEFSWVIPRIAASNLAYIGLRDVDPEEAAILDSLGITAYSMREVDRLGIAEVTRLALDKICPGFKRPLHVSFDIDSLDDLEVCNTGTPVAGGLTLREGIRILEDVSLGGNMVSMDLVEINPALGNSEGAIRTARVAKQLLINAFGYHRRGMGRQQNPLAKSF